MTKKGSFLKWLLIGAGTLVIFFLALILIGKSKEANKDWVKTTALLPKKLDHPPFPLDVTTLGEAPYRIMRAYTKMDVEPAEDMEKTALFFLKQTLYVSLDSTLLGISVVAQDLEVPWEMKMGFDGWLWLTQRSGKIDRLNLKTGEMRELLKIKDVYLDGSAGLQGMVFHPEFPDTPYIYVAYNFSYGATDSIKLFNISARCARYTYDKDNDTLIDQVIFVDSIGGKCRYLQGGRLYIPSDRKLIMTTSDGCPDGVSLDTSNLAGKILRMNLDGSIPKDNPFPGSYIYSYGHRNPQGLVEANGFLYSSEHGPDTDDEINIIRKGGNYGWPKVAGYCDKPEEQEYCTHHDVIEPIRAWSPTLATTSIDYYDNPAIPEWRNSILVNTLKEEEIRVLRLNEKGDSVISDRKYLDQTFGRLRDFCILPDGSILISTSNYTAPSPPAHHDLIIRLSPVSNDSIVHLFN